MELPVRTHARLPSVEELQRRHLHAKKSYWIAWVYNKSLALDRNVTATELDYSHELLRLSSADLERVKTLMRERGIPIPAESCKVTNLFLKDDEEEEEDQQDHFQAQHVRLSSAFDAEVFDALESRWEVLDSAYFIAWVQQHVRVAQNEHNASFDAENTSSYKEMMEVGPKIDAVETELFLLGWRRPPPRLVHTLFCSQHRVEQ
jgi:hypothetical protein